MCFLFANVIVNILSIGIGLFGVGMMYTDDSNKKSYNDTTIVFQGSREQLFKDKKNDIRNWLTADPAGL